MNTITQQHEVQAGEDLLQVQVLIHNMTDGCAVVVGDAGYGLTFNCTFRNSGNGKEDQAEIDRVLQRWLQTDLTDAHAVEKIARWKDDFAWKAKRAAEAAAAV